MGNAVKDAPLSETPKLARQWAVGGRDPPWATKGNKLSECSETSRPTTVAERLLQRQQRAKQRQRFRERRHECLDALRKINVEYSRCRLASETMKSLGDETLNGICRRVLGDIDADRDAAFSEFEPLGRDEMEEDNFDFPVGVPASARAGDLLIVGKLYNDLTETMDDTMEEDTGADLVEFSSYDVTMLEMAKRRLAFATALAFAAAIPIEDNDVISCVGQRVDLSAWFAAIPKRDERRAIVALSERDDAADTRDLNRQSPVSAWVAVTRAHAMRIPGPLPNGWAERTRGLVQLMDPREWRFEINDINEEHRALADGQAPVVGWVFPHPPDDEGYPWWPHDAQRIAASCRALCRGYW